MPESFSEVPKGWKPNCERPAENFEMIRFCHSGVGPYVKGSITIYRRMIDEPISAALLIEEKHEPSPLKSFPFPFSELVVD